jgi:hypothetical protein
MGFSDTHAAEPKRRVRRPWVAGVAIDSDANGAIAQDRGRARIRVSDPALGGIATAAPTVISNSTQLGILANGAGGTFICRGRTVTRSVVDGMRLDASSTAVIRNDCNCTKVSTCGTITYNTGHGVAAGDMSGASFGGALGVNVT